ncbi:hypothetical protein PQI64_15145 [Shewanella bicestrii]
MQSEAIADVTTWPSITLMIAILGAFITVAKLITYLYFERHKFNHKNLEIAQSSLSSNLHKPSLKQRFLTEHVFSLIYRCSLTYDEINVLLRYSNPSRAFELFVKGKAYLRLSNNMKSILLNDSYWRLKIGRFKFYPRDLLHFIRYCFLGVIGTFAFIPAMDVFDTGLWFTVPPMFHAFDLKGIYLFVISVTMGSVIWILAIKAILSIGKIGEAFNFIEIEK